MPRGLRRAARRDGITNRLSMMQGSRVQTHGLDLSAHTVGDVAGPLTIYFHGVPGAPSELGVFDAPARACGLKLLCWDRFALNEALTGPAYVAALAEAVRAIAGSHRVNLIGFSIGACVALHTCRLLGAQVGQLHLVSAAAPLQSGHFLPRMAGRAVFQAAMASTTRFKALTLGQGALARWAPGVMRSALFRSATGVERVLASDSAFRSSMDGLLRSSLLEGRAGYVRDILAYVQDWSAIPAQVRADTTLWHGSLDNWAPPDMAIHLQGSMQTCRQLHLWDGLAHFSCLYRSAPLICRQLANPRALIQLDMCHS
jgi:pimeloyl-ACP methyl ester carboxylesterase